MDSTHIPKEGQLLVGPLFSEPMLVETVRASGASVWTIGLVGSLSHEIRRVPLSESDLRLLRIVERVWEVVGRVALEQVLGTPAAQARNRGAGALEEDARLTALFLWTVQATDEQENYEADDEEEPSEDEDERTRLGRRSLA